MGAQAVLVRATSRLQCIPWTPSAFCSELQSSRMVSDGAVRGNDGCHFRNPHHLPTKVCMTCNRPFTWRKKWERCWDEVLTCSNRCKTERRRRPNESETPRFDVVAHTNVSSDLWEEQGSLENEESTSGSRADRPRARKQAMKEQQCSQRHDVMSKRKPCHICEVHVDLLIRCKCDATLEWRMLCGRCWTKASGGVPDGDVAHPHYRYGGLWKNRSAKVKMPSFGVKASNSNTASLTS